MTDNILITFTYICILCALKYNTRFKIIHWKTKQKKKIRFEIILLIKYTKCKQNDFPTHLCPTSATAVTLKTRRREVPGSNPCHACRPSRSEFSVVFSETRVNNG